LDDLAQIVGALREALCGLRGIGRSGGERGDVELQALGAQLETLERAGGTLETRTGQAAGGGGHFRQQFRNELARLPRRTAGIRQRTLSLQDRRGVAEQARKAWILGVGGRR